MTCQEVAEFLLEYLEGALPVESGAEFERHLAVCPACRDYLESYQSTIELERQAFRQSDGPAAEPPPELIAAILASRRW
ncbi:MAG: hypothetical protein C4547_10310 [Phycisphaerales bacterium]|nr:MAG: hypothetical protein C4547_10310 [Phycisphaerales bacterium]